MKCNRLTILMVLFLIPSIMYSKLVHLHPSAELPVFISPSMMNILDNSSIQSYNWSIDGSDVSIRKKTKEYCILYTTSNLNNAEFTLRYSVSYISYSKKETYNTSWTVRVVPPGDRSIWGDLEDGDFFQNYTDDGHLMLFRLNVNSETNETTAFVEPSPNGNPCVSTSVKGTVTIPAEVQGYAVTYIEDNAFQNIPDLEKIVIPGTIRRIGATVINNCPKVNSVTCMKRTPPQPMYSSGNLFDWKVYNNAILYVPKGRQSYYSSAKGWSQFKTIVETDIVDPNEVDPNDGVGVADVVTGGYHTLIVKEDGNLWACGNNDNGQLFLRTTDSWDKFAKTGISNVVSISALSKSSFYVNGDGEVYACGDAQGGQLGNGKDTQQLFFYAYIMDDASAVCGRGLTAYFIKKNNYLYGCGYNNSGQLPGYGNRVLTPRLVTVNVVKASFGGGHLLTVNKDGELYSCGWNYYGQLGTGTTSSSSFDGVIMSDVSSIAAGSNHSLIVKKDGSLWACGFNKYGQLCNGKVTDETSPVKVMDNVKDVAAYGNNSFIIKQDGSLWVCGENGSGQLGIGTTKPQYSPVKIMDNVNRVSANDHAMIIKNDGSLWACGNNESGQLGDGTTTNRLTPVLILKGRNKEFASIKVAKGMTTYTSEYNLDFSSLGDDVKAYVATGYDYDKNTIWLTRVKDVPAGTPILVQAPASETPYDVPVKASSGCYYKNMLVGNLSGGDITLSATTGDMTNYYLSNGKFLTATGSNTIGNGKAYLQIPTTPSAATVGSSQAVKLNDYGFASFCGSQDLDFTDVEGLKAFAVTGYDDANGTIWLTRVKRVSAQTPLLLTGDSKGSYSVPSVAVGSYYANMMKGNLSGSTITIYTTDGDMTNYYLKGNQLLKATDGGNTIGNGKAYMQIPTKHVTRSMEDVIADLLIYGISGDEPEVIAIPVVNTRGLNGDGTTNIREKLVSEQTNDVYYNLQGQRVEKPTKGLYIKNGKKVVIK